MSENTPTPWEARKDEQPDSDLVFWEVVHPDSRDKGPDDPNRDLVCDCSVSRFAEADARLIAAAPDLLAACKEVEPAIRTLMDELGRGPATNWKLVNDCLCNVAAAIAKAEGKVPQ
jgi:hypothetical protein